MAAQTGAPLWFQLYVWGDRGEIREAVARAKAAGFGALLFSIDTVVRSKREREKRAGLELPTPNLPLTTLLEGTLHPDWAWHFLTSPTVSFPNIGPPDQRSLGKISAMFDGTVRWEDLDWIRELWDGPIVAKGVIRPEEAVRAADAGLDGVIVSNHGGRQLDHLPATIDVLPDIVDAAWRHHRGAEDRNRPHAGGLPKPGAEPPDRAQPIHPGGRASGPGLRHYGEFARRWPGSRDLCAAPVRPAQARSGAGVVKGLTPGVTR